jgi:hypothetical protein
VHVESGDGNGPSRAFHRLPSTRQLVKALALHDTSRAGMTRPNRGARGGVVKQRLHEC